MSIGGSPPVNPAYGSAAPAPELNFEERRRHQRYALNSPAVCRLPDGRDLAVTIIDASEGGFGIDCNIGLAVDTVFEIVMAEAGTFRCRLAWFDDERCGVELLPAADYTPAALDDLARTLDPPS